MYKRQGQDYANYREIAPKVIDYVKKMGYTHVELMPVMEHCLFHVQGGTAQVTVVGECLLDKCLQLRVCEHRCV